MNIFDHITNLLSQDEAFALNGKLLKNKLIDATLNYNEILLQILHNDEVSRLTFFKKIGEVVVFDQSSFLKLISQRAFLPDSYTAYKINIGLNDGTDYIKAIQETVLAWPYKDTVLEGGQNKEDQSTQETFWNETLSKDYIDRMLDAKAFTHWYKMTSDGKRTDFKLSPDDNFIIKGNNLIALHSIAHTHQNKVKLIYIDPPYNTGNDSFQYNDKFSHSTWLTFMKNRLEIAWRLLRNDGVFFIQVDDTEFAYLKVLCDEIFGRVHFKETIVIKSSTESGVNAINVKRGEQLFKVKEYILFYAKSKEFRFNPFYTKTDFNNNYRYEVIKTGDSFTITDLKHKFVDKFAYLDLNKKEKDLLVSKETENYCLQHADNIYSIEKNIKKAGEKFKAFAVLNKPKGIVEEYLNSLNKIVLIYDGGVLVPLGERVVTEGNKKYMGVLASDLWVDIGTTPSSEGGINFSNGKKPEKLLRRIIEMTTSTGDIVLDYHLGSGTTAAVAHKLGRRYIGLEQMDYGQNDATVRLTNVINGETSGISSLVGWDGGRSFVYAELAQRAAAIIHLITNANTEHELAHLYEQVLLSDTLHYTLDVKKIAAHKSDFLALPITEKQKALIHMLDKNELYVHFTERNDASYSLNVNDIKLSEAFYNLKIH